MPERKHRILLCTIAVLVVLAGCSGTETQSTQPSVTTEGSAAASSQQKGPNAQADAADSETGKQESAQEIREVDLQSVSYPPGVTRAGVVVPETLLETHKQHLRSTTYRVEWDFSQSRQQYSEQWTFGQTAGYYDIESNGTIVSNAGQESYSITVDYGRMNRQDERHYFIFVDEELFHINSGTWGAAWDVETTHPTVIPERRLATTGSPWGTGVGRRVQGSGTPTPRPQFQTPFPVFHEQAFGVNFILNTTLHNSDFTAKSAVIRANHTYITYGIQSDGATVGTLVLRDDGFIQSVRARYGERTHFTATYNDKVTKRFSTPDWAAEARNDTVYFNQETIEQIREAAAADKDCADFATQAGAQSYSLDHDDGLDGDGDGIACEHLP